MKIRIKFTKQGPVKFIGHLDIMRYFQKAMRRAKVTMKYSEGFSPHQVMSFAAPLGVGLTSNGEYMDIEVQNTDDSKSMIHRLNTQMAEGIQVISYRKLADSSKNAMSIVAAADYTLKFRDSARPADIQAFAERFTDFCQKEVILILKKTKKSEKELNIRPMILEAYMKNEIIFMKLSTGSTDNLKPELVMDAFYQSQGLEYPEFAFEIQREEVYSLTNHENGGQLISLDQLGEDIE